MRLILNGCEYAGTTTLAGAISEWAMKVFGGQIVFHDHWKIPHVSHSAHTDEENDQFLALSPHLQESFQRYHMEYHVASTFYGDDHHNMVGFHIDEAVYAPLYYGYGGEGEYSDRKQMARSVEAHIMEVAPDTVLVLVKASPKVIARRIKENPHDRALVKENDIERVLQRFEEENERTFIRRKFTLDTTSVSVEESLAEFVDKFEPHMTEADRLRILTHGSSLTTG
jgi:hypothetical protein